MKKLPTFALSASLVVTFLLPACSDDETIRHQDTGAPHREASAGTDAPVTGADGPGALDGAPAKPDKGQPGKQDKGAGLDAAPKPDVVTKPQCVTDAQCGANRGCLAGICRDKCLFGLVCVGAASGPVCHKGLCVKCTTDAHCPGNRYQCSNQKYVCTERSFDPKLTKIGMFYSLWHCPHSTAKTVYNITDILAGKQSWGPLYKFHFWDRPVGGYYCLSQNDPVLKKHATMLAAAGIDFVFLDVTNHQFVGSGSDNTPGMILKPLDRMLATWSTIPNAPRLVPWVPVTASSANAKKYTVDAILQRLGKYPGMHFKYLGKPLILVTENAQYKPSAARLAALSKSYTVRRMWGLLQSAGSTWSFLQACKDSPTSSKPCQQRHATLGGKMEQVSITTAYQATYMNLPSATPKLKGLTFRKQFETLLMNPLAPIATITGWNEWMAQRMPCGKNPTCPCSKYKACFMDAYDMEYNRDIEPAQNKMGDYYYRLVKACVALFRKGALCDAAHANDLCCKSYKGP